MKGKKSKDKKIDVSNVVELMEIVINDTSVPRNIRRAVEEAREKVKEGKEESSVNISSAIYVLDDISNDINMPSHTRTDIWTIISQLEALKEKAK
ncbi:MAG: UPF0147 family protein [Candidatus Diapherotrites archaeon]